MDSDFPAGSSGSKQALGLDPALVDVLKAAAVPRRLKRGEVLMEQGSEPDALFFVLSGRFTVFANGAPIAEIGSGEPVGEVAFFGGGTRSASVVASRASEVLELSREAYERALAGEPGLSNAIITALATRLRRTVPTAAPLRPRPGHIIGIVPGGTSPLDPAAIDPLVEALGTDGAATVRGPEGRDAEAAIADLTLRSSGGRRVVLVCEDPERDPAWADIVFQHCDTVVVCLDRRRQSAAPVSALEAQVASGVLDQNIHLVLLRAPDAPISGTPEWLEGRAFGLHHHMAAGSRSDAARISRLVSGTALGVVLGGGGAYGTAHLAMLKALGEFGFEIDMVGGTSVGAAMAGAFAMGLSMDEVVDRFVDMFVTAGAATRYTVPLWSIMDHTHFDAQLQHHYGADRWAEDLPINYFAVSTSLTRQEPVVLRRGPLWKLIRASSAIPAVFPPMVMEDGEVLVDGGLFDNVPIEKMRDLKAGPNLVLGLQTNANWRVHTDYEALPGRGGAVRRVLFGRLGKKLRFPGISSIVIRSLMVNSERLQAGVDRSGDVFIGLPRVPGMGFLQWNKGRALFERTYAATAARLDALSAERSGMDLLHALAEPEERSP